MCSAAPAPVPQKDDFFFLFCSLFIEMHSACGWLHLKNLPKAVTECKPAVCLILLFDTFWSLCASFLSFSLFFS